MSAARTGIIAPTAARRSWGFWADLGPSPRAVCAAGDGWREWLGRGAAPRSCPRCGGAVTNEVARHQVRVQKWDLKRDAEAARDDAVADLRSGHHAAPSKLTVAEFLTDWLAGRTDLRPSTASSYRVQIGRHVLPALGHHRLQSLTPDDVSRLLADLSESGRLRAGEPGLSPASVAYVLSILRTAFADAVRRGALGRNPAELARGPKRRAPKLGTWTPEEATEFLSFTRSGGDRMAPLWHFLSWTGCRRGEALGLRWSDLDGLDGPAPRAAIARSLGMVRGRVVVGEPKTAAGTRTVPLTFDAGASPSLVDVLRHLRRSQVAERLAAGPAYSDGGYVFCRPDGRPYSPEHVSESFARAVRASGLPVVRLHDLRHSLASTLLGIGADLVSVSGMLGHANAGVTLRVYGHATGDGADRAAALMAARLATVRAGG